MIHGYPIETSQTWHSLLIVTSGFNSREGLISVSMQDAELAECLLVMTLGATVMMSFIFIAVLMLALKNVS